MKEVTSLQSKKAVKSQSLNYKIEGVKNVSWIAPLTNS
jgi:hypothetical protein